MIAALARPPHVHVPGRSPFLFDVRAVGVFRILLAGTVLFDQLIRAVDWRAFHSAGGLSPPPIPDLGQPMAVVGLLVVRRAAAAGGPGSAALRRHLGSAVWGPVASGGVRVVRVARLGRRAESAASPKAATGIDRHDLLRGVPASGAALFVE